MQQRQAAREHAEVGGVSGFPFKGHAVEQVEAGQQDAPAKQRGALGDEQVGDGVDPAHVGVDVVGGGLVEGGEDAGEHAGVGARTVQEVPKADAAAEEEQHKGQTGALFAAQEAVHQHKIPGEHGVERGEHGQAIGPLKMSTQQKIGGGDAVAQKGVAHFDARLYGIFRRKGARARQGGDEGEVHAHVAKAALSGVIGAVLRAQHVSAEQRSAQQQSGQHAE